MKKIVTILFMGALCVLPRIAFSQVSISTVTSSYSQDFNTLATTGSALSWTNGSTLNGWYLFANGAAVTTYEVSSGTTATGAVYSFGTGTNTDRAMGSVCSNGFCGASGTGTVHYGLRLKNDTGFELSLLPITYTGEQWRNGGNATQQTLTFSYQISSSAITSLTTGTWTNETNLNFQGPIATITASALDGNLTANRTTITYTLTGINIPIGGEIMLRWTDLNDSGNDHGLAIDDLTINPSNVNLPIELADFTAQASNGDVTLNWQTISEINSDVFEVQHLAGGEWVTVATVQAAGASTDVRSYTQAVKGLQVGTHYFRLKSVDKDGGVKYSKQIAVAVEVPGTFVMNPAYPNPFNPQTTLTFAVAKKQAVTMTLFNALGQQISVLYQGSPEANTLQTVQLNGSTLQSGAYFVRLTGENFSGMQKVMLVK